AQPRASDRSYPVRCWSCHLNLSVDVERNPARYCVCAGGRRVLAGGTVYLKWAQIEADQMGVGSWQMTIAAVILAACMLIFDGGPQFGTAHLDGVLATAWTGIASNGIAYALWFTIIQRLPAVTASLGVLASPVIGVIGSFAILGEVPSASDMVGFAL